MHKFDLSHVFMLDEPERRGWQSPEKIMDIIGVQKGTAVLEIGSGTGYFTRELINRVGDDGIVFAADINPQLLAILSERTRGAKNLEIVQSGENYIPMDSHSVDLIFMGNVFHELSDPASIIKEMKRLLKPGGRCAVVDWKKTVSKEEVPGPPTEERINEEAAANFMKASGFQEIMRDTSNLKYHYIIIFENQNGLNRE